MGLNAFNLLPLSALDGGQLLNLLIFSRHRVLESVFLGLGGVAMVVLGLSLGQYLLVGLGALGLPSFRLRQSDRI